MLTEPFTDRALVFATERDLTPRAGGPLGSCRARHYPGVPLTDEVVFLRSVSKAVAAVAIASSAAKFDV